MLRVAIVGAGHWGPNLIGIFHNHPRSEVAWVVDSDAARLEVAAERFPDVRCATSLDEALADPQVDAVAIATPTRTHYALARAALESGRPVLVEKPLAATAAEGEALCELAATGGLVLMVGHVFLFNAAARRAKDYLDAGELGRIYYISMERTNLGPIRVDVNAAWDLAAHDLSLASWWLDSQPLSVSARGGSWINEGVEDAVFATLRYPDDVLVNLHASWLHPRKGREIAIVGDAKLLTFDDTDAKEPLRLYDKQVAEERTHPIFVDSLETFRMAVRDGSVVVPEVPSSSPLLTECESFLACVLDGAESISGGAEGLGVVRALEAMSRSLEEDGREVAVVGSS